MEFLKSVVDLFLHLDAHLTSLISDYGTWTYAILFLVIFCETGLVVTPFLPGDSLLFAAGALAATGALHILPLVGLLMLASMLGDTTNYAIGRRLGTKPFENPRSRFFKRKYLDDTHAFYEKYGGNAIIMAKFVPIVRTFAPFLAGVGSMTYSKFVMYNATSAILWVSVCAGGGYLFGNLPIVKEHFSLVVLTIIVLSILPGVIAFLRARKS